MSELVPETWAIEAISNISKVGSSKRILQSEYVADGVPFFRSKEVILRSKRKQIKDTLYIARSRFDELKSKFGAPKPNDILVTAVGTIGTIYLIEDIEFYFKDGNLLWIKDINDSVHPQYLAKYMASDIFQTAIERISGGSSQSALTIEKLSQLELNLPPLPEQQKIAQILTSVDEVIEKTQAQIDKLKDLKTGMMQELLTKGIGHVEFKDSPVGRIPVGWEVERIETLAIKVGSGVTPKGGSQAYVDVGIPLIRSQNVHSDGLKLDNVSFITEEQHQKMSNSQLKPNDVLLNITGASIGRCFYLPDAFLEGNVNQHVCIIRLNKARANHVYLTLMLNSQMGQSQIMSLQAGGNREGLNFQQIRAIKLALPPLSEQVEIGSIISSIEDKIHTQSVRLRAINDTKKALMQDLLTGKVRVKTEQSNKALAVG